MTILGGLFPVESRWGYFWDPYPGSTSGSTSSNTWDNSPSQPSNFYHQSKVIEIPIQFVGRNGSKEKHKSCLFDYHSEWSDSDSEDNDMNCNSQSGNPRKRRSQEGRQTPPKLRSSKAVVYPEVIQVDEEVPVRHVKFDSNQADSSSQLTRRGLRAWSSNSEKLKHTGDIVDLVCDTDTEDEINETNNYSVYQYLKGLLQSAGRQIDCIRGDGNCFFRALSKVIYGSQNFYNDIRQAVVDVLAKHPRKFEAFTDGTISDHIRKMREDKTWATQTEIYAAATLLNRDIYILSPDQTGDTYRWLLFKPQFKYNASVTGCKCYITLCHTHGNHYDRIAACKSSCNCGLAPPEMSGVKGSVDLTNDEIV